MVIMDDGRRLMANKADIMEFMEQHNIVGRTICGVYPELMDYGIGNWDELMDEWGGVPQGSGPVCFNTDGSVFIAMQNDEWLEIEFSGEGPVILNMLPPMLPYGRPAPKVPVDLFSLNTVFQQCYRKKIVDIQVDVRTDHDGMMFPCYRGIDMSSEYDGMWRIRLVLEDGNCLAFYGNFDFFGFELKDENGTTVYVPSSYFQGDGPEGMKAAIKEENYEKILGLIKAGADYPIIDPLWECPYIWTLRYLPDRREYSDICLEITEELLKHGEDPAAVWEAEALLDDVVFDLFNVCGPEQCVYLSKFLIRLIAYGGKTEYCTPQIKGTFDLDHLERYRFLMFEMEDGYHLHGEIWDEKDNVIAIV